MTNNPAAAIGWWHFQDAPLNITGQVWCADMGEGEACLGVVRHRRNGERYVRSPWAGYTFTHWHPIARPPAREATLEAALHLADVFLTYPAGTQGDKLSRLLSAVLYEGVWSRHQRAEAAELERGPRSRGPLG